MKYINHKCHSTIYMCQCFLSLVNIWNYIGEKSSSPQRWNYQYPRPSLLLTGICTHWNYYWNQNNKTNIKVLFLRRATWNCLTHATRKKKLTHFSYCAFQYVFIQYVEWWDSVFTDCQTDRLWFGIFKWTMESNESCVFILDIKDCRQLFSH